MARISLAVVGALNNEIHAKGTWRCGEKCRGTKMRGGMQMDAQRCTQGCRGTQKCAEWHGRMCRGLWRGTQRYVEVCGSMQSVQRGTWRFPNICRCVQRYMEVCGGMWRVYRVMWRVYRVMWRYVECTEMDRVVHRGV